MKIVDGNKFVPQIHKFAAQLVDGMNGWNDDYYFLHDIVNNNELNYLKAIVDNDKVIDLIVYHEVFGVPSFNCCFYSKRANEMLNLIRTEYGDTVYVSGEYRYLHNYGMYPVSIKSTYKPRMEYCLGSDYHLWVYTADRVNMLVDALENKYMKASIDNLEFKCLTSRELYNLSYDKELRCVPYWQEPGSFSHQIGFTYLRNDDGINPRYLVALADNILVGCIKYDEYADDKVYGINYIDVHYGYRQKGIAKQLIEHLSKTIDDRFPVLMSQESEMGKQCHMHELFGRYEWPNGLLVERDYRYVPYK